MFQWTKRLFKRKRFVEVDIKKVRSIQELSRGPAVQPLTSAQVRAMFPDRTKPQVPTSTTSLRPARTGGYADAPRSYYSPSSGASDPAGYYRSGNDVLTGVLVAEAIEHLEAPSSVSDDYSSSGSDSADTDSFAGSGGDFGGGGSSEDY